MSRRPRLTPPRGFLRRRVNKNKDHIMGWTELIFNSYALAGSSGALFRKGIINKFDKKSKEPR